MVVEGLLSADRGNVGGVETGVGLGDLVDPAWRNSGADCLSVVGSRWLRRVQRVVVFRLFECTEAPVA